MSAEVLELFEFNAEIFGEQIKKIDICNNCVVKSHFADALDGKINLVITKSVSCFARNTVDSLFTIRKLKEHNVEYYFEKEQIWTFDGKGENTGFLSF